MSGYGGRPCLSNNLLLQFFMKTFYIFLLLLILLSCKKNVAHNILPASDNFLINAGGKETELVNNMDVDNNGNIYITGKSTYNTIGDSLFFGSSIVQSSGGEDIIVAKYDRHGNAIWARLVGSKSWDEGETIAADDEGNCYVAGIFGAKINFDKNLLTPQVIINNNGTPNHLDMFLAKYDQQGKVNWVKQVSGVGFERPTAMQTDKAGNVVVTGYYRHKINFGSTTLTAPGSALFIAKYASNGNFLWAKSYGSNIHGDLYPTRLKFDNNENIIITGSFENTHSIGGINIQSNGNQDVFIAKFDNSGTTQWVKTFGGTKIENSNALAIDKSNNIYIGGLFKDVITTGGSAITSTDNSSDAFFAKLSANGNPEWLKHASGNGEESVQDMFILNDTLYSLGYFTQNFKLDNYTTNNTGWYGFVSKHDLKGLAVGCVDMNLNSGTPKNIYLDASGYSIIAGYFSNTFSFDNMSSNAYGGFDLFLLKNKLSFK